MPVKTYIETSEFNKVRALRVRTVSIITIPEVATSATLFLKARLLQVNSQDKVRLKAMVAEFQAQTSVKSQSNPRPSFNKICQSKSITRLYKEEFKEHLRVILIKLNLEFNHITDLDFLCRDSKGPKAKI